MKALGDTTAGDWLIERAGEWGSVGGVAGVGFAAYARILHPVPAWRSDDTAKAPQTWGWAEVARRNGRAMHPLVQWFSLTDDEERLSFDDGWQVGQSEDGQLRPQLLSALTEHLAAATSTPDEVTAAVWEGWGELHPGSGALLL